MDIPVQHDVVSDRLSCKLSVSAIATSELLSESDKCLSHLRFPVGRPWRCLFVNFERSVAQFDGFCVRRILKYLTSVSKKTLNKLF